MKPVDVAIKDIKIDRETDLDDDLRGLTASIMDQGLKFPILLDEDYNLIDGFRRIGAYTLLGLDKITSYVSRSLEDSVDVLQLVHTDGTLALPLGTSRTYEMWRALDGQVRQRASRLRRRQKGKPRNSKLKDPKAILSRLLFVNALGLSSEGYLQSIFFVHSHRDDAEPVGAIAEEALQLMNAGQITPYEANGMIRRAQLQLKLTRSESDQRQILTNAAISLSGTGKALSTLAEINPRIRLDEAQGWLTALLASQTQITRTVRKLRERLENG